MNPVVLHIVRPYASEAEYLAAEAWTIESRGMLLVDQAPLENDTAVVFDIALADGSKVIRAEGRVVGHLVPGEDRPGGVRVRFKRFGAQTKGFIERAVQEREQQLSRRFSSHPPLAAAPVALPSLPAPATPQAARAPLSAPPPFTTEFTTQASPIAAPLRAEPSGIQRRPVTAVAAPANREELLARLRSRIQPNAVGAVEPERTGTP